MAAAFSTGRLHVQQAGRTRSGHQGQRPSAQPAHACPLRCPRVSGPSKSAHSQYSFSLRQVAVTEAPPLYGSLGA